MSINIVASIASRLSLRNQLPGERRRANSELGSKEILVECSTASGPVRDRKWLCCENGSSIMHLEDVADVRMIFALSFSPWRVRKTDSYA